MSRKFQLVCCGAGKTLNEGMNNEVVIYGVDLLCGRYILSLPLLAGVLVGEERSRSMNLEVAGFVTVSINNAPMNQDKAGLTVTWPSVLAVSNQIKSS